MIRAWLYDRFPPRDAVFYYRYQSYPFCNGMYFTVSAPDFIVAQQRAHEYFAELVRRGYTCVYTFYSSTHEICLREKARAHRW